MGIKGLQFILSPKHLIPQFLVICSVMSVLPLKVINIHTQKARLSDTVEVSLQDCRLIFSMNLENTNRSKWNTFIILELKKTMCF